MHSDAARKESFGKALGHRRLMSRWLACAGLAIVGIGSVASAAETPPGSDSTVTSATTDASEATPTQGLLSWQRVGLNGNLRLDLHGSAAVDLGFDKYTFPDNAAVQPNTPDEVYDLRGRFVLGVDLDYEFAPKYFLHGRGQFVAWVREVAGTYQGNADDVYVQAGQRDVWDIMLGRFLTWRVFRKGLGFDLYTLEDQGPLNNMHVSDTAAYAPHIYEVSTMFFRGTQGRAAFHLYPTPWSGIEIVGEYGKPDIYNSVGGRIAGNITYGPMSVSAAAEAKRSKLAVEVPGCSMCGVKNDSGYGGGAVLDFRVIEIGANVALARTTSFLNDGTTGAEDPTQSSTTTSFGGYLEVDPGSLLFKRRLALGAGWDRSEFTFRDDRFLQHTQEAAYIAYPLVFNDGMIKVVVSRADYIIDTPIVGMPGFLTENQNRLFSVRVRTSFRF
jgi:hypothetical protein